VSKLAFGAVRTEIRIFDHLSCSTAPVHSIVLRGCIVPPTTEVKIWAILQQRMCCAVGDFWKSGGRRPGMTIPLPFTICRLDWCCIPCSNISRLLSKYHLYDLLQSLSSLFPFFACRQRKSFSSVLTPVSTCESLPLDRETRSLHTKVGK
jgi:hypothetical protein